jgi:hypothetical protein
MKKQQLKALIKSIIRESLGTPPEQKDGPMQAVNLEGADDKGWHAARVKISPVEQWCVVQDFTAQYLTKDGEWDRPMHAKVFSSRGEAEQFAAEKLGGGIGKPPSLQEVRQLSVPERHQLRIALQTLKMHDAAANVMGGPNKEEAREILKRFGYTDQQIQKLEQGGVKEETGTSAVAGYQTPNAFSKKRVNESQDPDRDEMMNYLKSQYGREPGWQDDAEAAMYWFGNFYHGGDASNLYSVMSTSPFSPGPIARGPQKGSMEEMMFQSLVHQFAGGEGLDDEEEVDENTQEKHPADDYDQTEIDKICRQFRAEVDVLKQKNPNLSFGYIGNVWNDARYSPRDDRAWYIFNGGGHAGKKWGGYSTYQLPEMWKKWEAAKAKIAGQIGITEMTTTGAVAGYETPNAFTKNKSGSKRATDATKKLGFKVVGPSPRV